MKHFTREDYFKLLEAKLRTPKPPDDVISKLQQTVAMRTGRIPRNGN